MNVLQFGDIRNPIILFFQGSMTHYTWYEKSIEELSEHYYLIVPVLKGHNGDDLAQDDFVSVEDTAREIEKFLIENDYENIWGAYGLSIGGSIISYMLAKSKIKIKKAIIDGGIAPYQYPWIFTRAILLRDFLAIKLIQNSKTALKHFLKINEYELSVEEIEKYYDEIVLFLKTVSNRTIKNIFDSANNYEMPRIIPETDTKIEYWVGEKERRNRKRDIMYLLEAFPNMEVCQIDSMEHGELVTMKPLEFGKRAMAFFSKGVFKMDNGFSDRDIKDE